MSKLALIFFIIPLAFAATIHEQNKNDHQQFNDASDIQKQLPESYTSLDNKQQNHLKNQGSVGVLRGMNKEREPVSFQWNFPKQFDNNQHSQVGILQQTNGKSASLHASQVPQNPIPMNAPFIAQPQPKILSAIAAERAWNVPIQCPANLCPQGAVCSEENGAPACRCLRYCSGDNPCTFENLRIGRELHAYPQNPTYYIHCDVIPGTYWVRPCPANTVWDAQRSECNYYPNNNNGGGGGNGCGTAGSLC
ncbi:hypothetical protein SNEBB_007412 [Seison nebaliae]|nr:hypothetical protein SNEBB_007412 [Seison nebaliae]